MNNIKEKIEAALEFVKSEVLEELIENVDFTNASGYKIKSKCFAYLRQKYNIKGYPSKGQKNYWLVRGYSKEEAEEKIKNYSHVFSRGIKNVMSAYNVSEEEAKQIIKERSEKGQKTLHTKYTKEEIEKINEKKKFSLENCIRIYGEAEGKVIYEKRLKRLKQGITSEMSYIERYGEKEGKIQREKLLHKIRKQNTLDGYKEKYGDLKGEDEFEKTQKRKSFAHTLEGYTERYGKKEGERLFLERQKKWLKTLNDKPEEEKKRINRSKWKSYEELVERHGSEKALEIYKSRQPGFKASKESLKFFIPLYKHLRKNGFSKEDIYWGIGSSEEYFLCKKYDGKNMFFSYDFTILSKKVIIEYNGVCWHGKSMYETKTTPFGTPLSDIYKKDMIKRLVAEKSGFTVFTVWSNDCLDEKLEEMKGILCEKKL